MNLIEQQEKEFSSRHIGPTAAEEEMMLKLIGVKNLNEQFAMMSKSMEAMNTYYAKLTEASNAMSSSAQDAIRAKEQIALLADNLTQLNKVYGNMIIAMQGR